MNNQVFQEYKTKMDKTISVMHDDLKTVRAGKASPSVLDRIRVDYYGSMTPLNQMANISVPEPRLLVIQPYDATAIDNIVKAIEVSDLGINPNVDGKIIRLPFPMLTEERRKELVKVVHKIGEKAKVAIRNERRSANDVLKKLEKSGDISEDEMYSGLDDIQEMTDKHVSTIDSEVKAKEAEILEV